MGKRDEVAVFKEAETKIQKANADYVINDLFEAVDEPYLPDIASAAVTSAETRQKAAEANAATQRNKEQERRINVVKDAGSGISYRLGATSGTLYLEEV